MQVKQETAGVVAVAFVALATGTADAQDAGGESERQAENNPDGRNSLDVFESRCEYSYDVIRPMPRKNSKSTTIVAPVFLHGGGSGATGCLISPPVFLSEAAAREIIIAELAKEGITFDKTDADLVKDGLLVNDPGEKFHIVLDGYSTTLNLGFEYVSTDDVKAFGGIASHSTGQQYDLRGLAENARAAAFVTLSEAETAVELARIGETGRARVHLEHVAERVRSIEHSGTRVRVLIALGNAYGLAGANAAAAKYLKEAESGVFGKIERPQVSAAVRSAKAPSGLPGKTASPDVLGAVLLAKAFAEIGEKKNATATFERAMRMEYRVWDPSRLAHHHSGTFVEAARWFRQLNDKNRFEAVVQESVRVELANLFTHSIGGLLWPNIPYSAFVLLAKTGRKDDAADGLRRVLERMRASCLRLPDAAHELAVVGAAYEGAGIPCDESCRKLLSEIVQNAKEAGGRKPVLTSPAGP